MNSRKSKYILYGVCLSVLLMTFFICGKQIMDAAQLHVDNSNDRAADRYAEIEKALGR